MTGPKTQATVATEETDAVEWGDLVVIESGPFAGWLGEYDDDSGSSYVVVPLYPLTCAPYVVARKVRPLTKAEEHATNGGLQHVIRALSGTLGAEVTAGLEAVFAEAARLVRSRESSDAKVVAERAKANIAIAAAFAPPMPTVLPTVFTPCMHERKSKKP